MVVKDIRMIRVEADYYRNEQGRSYLVQSLLMYPIQQKLSIIFCPIRQKVQTPFYGSRALG